MSDNGGDAEVVSIEKVGISGGLDCLTLLAEFLLALKHMNWDQRSPLSVLGGPV